MKIPFIPRDAVRSRPWRDRHGLAMAARAFPAAYPPKDFPDIERLPFINTAVTTETVTQDKS